MGNARRTIWPCILLLLLVTGSSYSTGDHAPGPKSKLPALPAFTFPPARVQASPYLEPVVTTDSPTAVLHFRRAGNLILIKAKADTTEGYFILDTGAPYLVLNMTYFRDYPAAAEMEGVQGGITGATHSLNPTKVARLALGPFTYHQMEADRIQLGHIEDNKGVKILGLLGMRLFVRFEMIIDYANNLIHLHLIGKKESKTYRNGMLKDEAAYTTYPIVVREDKIMVKATFGNKTLTFIIDTGAESNVIDSRLPNAILETIRVNRRVKLTGNGGQKVDALYGDLSNLKIGNSNFANLPVLVTNLEKMCSAYNTNCLDGMLGFDFLSQHKIGFNFVSRKMYIWK